MVNNKKKKKRTAAKKGNTKGSNPSHAAPGSTPTGPSPKAAQADAKHASEQVPILSSAGQGKNYKLPEGKSPGEGTGGREEEPVSLFSDRLPFASPTLQLLQQEKLLGIRAHQARSWELAESHFLHALRLASESYPDQLPSLHSALGVVHFHMKRYEEAIEDCNSALRASVQHWPAYLCRSFAYSCLKNLPLAASDYDKAATLLQRSGLPDKKLNRILKRAQDAALDSGTVRQKDKRLEVLDELGELYFTAKTDIYPKDQSIYDEMPLLVPVGEPLVNGDNWCCHIDKLTDEQAKERAMQAKQNGNTAFNNKDWNSALLNYSLAIRLNPNNAVFYSNRACVYLKLERYTETISDCTASIKREPAIKAYARRAAARAKLGENQLACEDYLQALAFEPTNQSCLSELARCLFNIEQEIVQRIESCTHAVDRSQLKKQLMLVRKDITTVGSRLKEPLSRANKKASPHAHAHAHAHAHSHGHAHSHAHAHAHAHPPSASPASASASTPASKAPQQGSPLAQIALSTKELERDSCNSRAYLERALAHESLHDYERAEKDFRDGLRFDPDNKDLQRGLRHLLQQARAN